MTREEAGRIALDALAKIQWNVAMILEAKAVEAEKVRNWLINHLTHDTFVSHQDQLNASLQFGSLNVQVIDGLAKVCNGLTRNLKAALQSGADSDDIIFASDENAEGDAT
jgi:hypothetical protein